ncbi:MAG TPA: amino acid ABC transporter permease [Burkholderiaceae bacterium]|nr:amino acid ABC transporter permease [Burkholderiaceae bacterium]
MTAVFQPIAPREAPIKTEGLVPWVRTNLFGDIRSTIITLVLLLLAVIYVPRILDWAVFNAVYAPSFQECGAARGVGACWGVIVEKGRFIVMGRYPYAQQWRPEIATLLMIALIVVSCMRVAWKPWLAVVWVIIVPAIFILMGGGIFGLTSVGTDLWGGLPLTILLATFGIVLAFPLSVLVALGRRSNLPAIRTICILYVELIRGVPLISVLFMAAFMFPLFMPVGKSPDQLLRVLIGIILFAAAYLAETVRGGLQAIPKGQVEAAQSLGLSYWQTQRKIVLPQALAIVVPGIMNNFIAIFKDTSLVAIVSLFELTGAMQLAINADAEWRPYKIEGYFFIALIYFVFCFAMSRYSLWIEKQVNVSKTR